MNNQLQDCSQDQKRARHELPLKRQRELLGGLERFVHTDNAEWGHVALSSAWRAVAFWPADIQDGETGSLLDWHTEGHALFLGYRDTLRALWRFDQAAIRFGALAHLLGVSNGLDAALRGARVAGFPGVELGAERLRSAYPYAKVGSTPISWPNWVRRAWDYRPNNDFQEAVDLLWKQR